MTAAPEALDRLAAARVVAVLRVDSREHAAPAVAALVEGGVGAVELTWTSPAAAEELAAARAAHPDLLLGAGTLLNPAEVEAALAAGADFLVSPHLDRELLAAMLDSGRLVLPGCFTPSEVATALAAGAAAIKLFPAAIGGVAHLKALRGPFPELRAVPTGGVSARNVGEWLAAGALAVGVGGELCRRDLIEAGQWDAISELARDFVRGAAG